MHDSCKFRPPNDLAMSGRLGTGFAFRERPVWVGNLVFDLKDEAKFMTALERSPFAPGALLQADDPGDGAGALSAIAGCAERSAELYRLLGLFCHSVRNKLNSLHLCLYMLETEGEPWPEAMALYRETIRTIEAIQAICRPLTLDLVELPLDLLIDDRLGDWRAQLAGQGVAIEVHRPAEPLWSAFDPSRMSRALEDVVDWRRASLSSGSQVHLGWYSEADSAILQWTEQGGSGEADDEASAGALPLAVLVRLLSSMGGRVMINPGPCFGLTLRWPVRTAAQGSPLPA